MLHQEELIVCASTDCKVLTIITKVEKTPFWISDPWFLALADREKISFYSQCRQIYSEINKVILNAAFQIHVALYTCI